MSVVSTEKIGPMTPRQRVMASLAGEPVDRIPYCEHLVDVYVAMKTVGWPDRLGAVVSTLKRLGLKGLVGDLLLAQAAGKNLGEDTPFWTADESKAIMRIGGALEPSLSRLLGRDNITFWGPAGCFENFQPYRLNHAERSKGWSADGVIKTPDDLDKMVFADIGEVAEMCEEFLEHKGDFAACAMVFLGIDPCWHSMGFENFSLNLALDPEFVGEVLGRICDWYARCMEEVCKLDFDFIWAADDIAHHQNPFFSPKTYREVLLPHTRKVAEKITKPWIYHSDGNLMPIMDDLLSQGMNAIHPLEPGSMNLEQIKQRYGSRITLVGNIDLAHLEKGTEQDVEKDVQEAIRLLGPGYRYMLCSSNSITPNVKPQNLTAMLKALKKYGMYPASW